MAGSPTLIVGFGNTLRGDDGAGWKAAQLLVEDPRVDGAVIVARHQLTPELAEDISRAGLVVLIDARRDSLPTGSVAVSMVRPKPNRVSSRLSTHDLDPSALVGLAERMFGPAPPVVLVSVSAAKLDHGDRLSPEMRAAMPAVLDAVVRAAHETRTGASGA